MSMETLVTAGINYNDPAYETFKGTSLFKWGPMTLSHVQFNKNFLLASTPFIQGYGMVVPMKMPAIMRETTGDALWSQFIMKILANSIKGVDGISNLSVESDEIQMGGDGNVMQTATKTSGVFKDFTITLPSDLATSPVANYFAEIARRIYDPYVNRAYHYPGSSLRYSTANHSFEFMIINCDPTMKRVLKYFYLQNCVATEGKLDHWNFTRGDTSTSELQVPFTCRPAPYNALTHIWAQTYLTAVNKIMGIVDGVSKNITDDLSIPKVTENRPVTIATQGGYFEGIESGKTDGITGLIK